MERAMGGEITVWWGPDDMVSALGFGTEENMAAVRAMKSSLAVSYTHLTLPTNSRV